MYHAVFYNILHLIMFKTCGVHICYFSTELQIKPRKNFQGFNEIWTHDRISGTVLYQLGQEDLQCTKLPVQRHKVKVLEISPL